MTSTLLLIDGYAVIYRAFYAIKNLSSSSGQPTNAVFGFIRMISQLKAAVGPTHWAVVLDGGLPEERMKLVPAYKAQRPKMPHDLEVQLPFINRYLDACSIQTIVVDGEEADDVLASLAVRYADDFERVLIATSDKDLYQVVNKKIQMVALSSGNVIVGEQEILAKTGVTPQQTLEWLALIGDSADNIAGVPGIGSKTATKLISQFGSIKGIYENIELIPLVKIREALIGSRDIVMRNIEMITLRKDIVSISSVDMLEVNYPKYDLLLELFEELDFAAMAKDIREPELF